MNVLKIENSARKKGKKKRNLFVFNFYRMKRVTSFNDDGIFLEIRQYCAISTYFTCRWLTKLNFSFSSVCSRLPRVQQYRIDQNRK